ncbi:MAG TPA: trehalose-phosphatase [Xanthobacteraceae bacterium]|nr:trehalose-phosphatase [Xanthobacteraceae bacterium]
MIQTVPLPSRNLRELAILLDVDGTILDIAPMPAAVSVPASLRRTLARLLWATGGALALVSGRSLGDLDALFAPLRLPAIGGHGAELRASADGEPEIERAQPLDGGIKDRLAGIANRAPGVLVEDKGYAVAVHYRLAPAHEHTVKQEVAALQADWPQEAIEVLPGKKVVEVKPAGFDKGAAIRALMRHQPFAGRRPVFIGDDTTDLPAFAALPEFGGIGFSVGREAPGTAYCFARPSDVRRWLNRLSVGEGTRAS